MSSTQTQPEAAAETDDDKNLFDWDGGQIPDYIGRAVLLDLLSTKDEYQMDIAERHNISQPVVSRVKKQVEHALSGRWDDLFSEETRKLTRDYLDGLAISEMGEAEEDIFDVVDAPEEVPEGDDIPPEEELMPDDGGTTGPSPEVESIEPREAVERFLDEEVGTGDTFNVRDIHNWVEDQGFDTSTQAFGSILSMTKGIKEKVKKVGTTEVPRLTGDEENLYPLEVAIWELVGLPPQDKDGSFSEDHPEAEGDTEEGEVPEVPEVPTGGSISRKELTRQQDWDTELQTGDVVEIVVEDFSDDDGAPFGRHKGRITFLKDPSRKYNRGDHLEVRVVDVGDTWAQGVVIEEIDLVN